MKKIVCLGLVLLLVTLLLPAKPSEAHGGNAFLPGLIIGGIIGWGLSPYYYYPRYYYYPPPAYYYPPPSYYYQAPPPPTPPAAPPAVTPPPPPPPAQESGGRMFIYPRLNQSEETQAKDWEECHRWAVAQVGYDPSKPLTGTPDGKTIQRSEDYLRAISACLDARGYTVR
jgi:hypothetical protein